MKLKTESIPFAVMMNGTSLKKWQADTIRRLHDSGLAHCVLVISNPTDFSHNMTFFKRYFSRDALYRFLLHRLFSVHAEAVSPHPFDPNVPFISMEAIQKGASHYFTEEQVNIIRSHQPEFVLRFGYNILKGNILQCAPRGIWSFHHGDERAYRGGPFGFWEIMQRNPSTGVILQKLTPKLDAGHVLIRRSYITVMHSWKEMRQRLLNENTDMPLLAVKKYLLQQEEIPSQSSSEAPIYKVPSNVQMFFFMLILWKRRLLFHFHRMFTREKWFLAEGELHMESMQPLFNEHVTIKPTRKSEFFADPFLLRDENGAYRILFEHYCYIRQKGEIASYTKDANIQPWKAETHHLAYPFVFQHDNACFVLPEQANSGVVSLLTLHHDCSVKSSEIILQQPLVDPSLLFHEGRYYLFGGLKDDLPNEKLHVFWADQLHGPYYPHALNPVKVHPQGSRPGGSFFKNRGNLYRVAQVFEFYYGHKVHINKIIELSPQRFNEVFEWSLEPTSFHKKYKGLHTFSIYNNKYVVDLKQHVTGIPSLRYFLKTKRRRKHD